MKVRDELSGEVFEATAVRWVRSGRLPRDTVALEEAMRACGEVYPVPGWLPWARATDGGKVRWLPVEVLS